MISKEIDYICDETSSIFNYINQNKAARKTSIPRNEIARWFRTPAAVTGGAPVTTAGALVSVFTEALRVWVVT